MCQRPKRAFIISTDYNNFKIAEEVCVNALNGLLSFLRTAALLLPLFLLMCQRPKRAFIISTISKAGK